jgi:hypothetical protein
LPKTLQATSPRVVAVWVCDGHGTDEYPISEPRCQLNLCGLRNGTARQVQLKLRVLEEHVTDPVGIDIPVGV